MIFEKLKVYGTVLTNESMKNHTTFHIGGNVDYYIYPKNLFSFERIIDILKEENLPYHVLGRGSNILVNDKDFHGAIICLDRYINDYFIEEDGTLLAESGCSIINLSVEAMKNSLTGLEWASGIPGSIGGALYMNAGAYRSNMEAVVKKVCVFRDGKIEWISKEECEFGYRHSIFQVHKDWVVLAVQMKLEKGKQEEIRGLMDSRRARRLASQPLDKPCAGSVFRNPDSMPAWKIIEQMGFRGYQIGGATVSEKHCNFIVNENNMATSKDVKDLISLIQQRAKEEYKIDLITEVEQLNW